MDEKYIALLETWSKQNNIIEKCQANFWICYENYKTDSPKEFSEIFRNENRKCVSIILDKIKFCLNHNIDYGKPTIEVDFNILLNGSNIGWYREIYFTNGDFVDEFFVIA